MNSVLSVTNKGLSSSCSELANTALILKQNEKKSEQEKQQQEKEITNMLDDKSNNKDISINKCNL